MTEPEVTAKLKSDTEAASGRPGLSDPEVAEIVKSWFYSSGSFLPALATPARQARAAAEGWRKQAGKVIEPPKYLSQGDPVESNAHFTNCTRMEARWLAEAERLEEEGRRSTASAQGTPQATTTYRATPSF